jgi:hypothetical protein
MPYKYRSNYKRNKILHIRYECTCDNID